MNTVTHVLWQRAERAYKAMLATQGWRKPTLPKRGSKNPHMHGVPR
jgi:hypothetical protein